MPATTLPDSVKMGMIVYPDTIASPLPLERTQVHVHVTGLIASVVVTQTFSNPITFPAELEYLFPLPEQAALLDFAMNIGARTIHAELLEIEQARQAYEQARQEGKHAALLEQRRSNLVAVKLANVLPEETIRATIQYEERLVLQPGELEFIFPMGLTPRYHSPEHPEESHGVNPPLALPGEKIGPVQIEVIADLGVACEQPISPSHPLAIENHAPGQYTVQLDGPNIPDHDFVLRFPIASKQLEISAWIAQDSSGEVLLANWLPGDTDPEEFQPTPREFVFVLDRSGSMTGEPIRQARNALRACLRVLEAQDTFRLLLFDDQLEWYRESAIQVNQSEVDQADHFLGSIGGRGGTEIVQALQAALNLPTDPERTRFVIFLTDGAVSAENRVFDQVRKLVGQSRIFTFGIGPSVNRGLLSKMAQIGRGAATYLQLDEDIEGAIVRFQDKVAFPLLTDLQIEWKNCRVWDAYPAILPDLYAGESLQLACRLKRNPGPAPAALLIQGRRGQQAIQYHLELPAIKPEVPEIPRAWAQARIEDLLDQASDGRQPSHRIRQEIISLAMEHRLLTPFTAFVALDSDVVNETGKSRPIAIAQPLPKGLDWAGFHPVSAPVLMPQGMPMGSTPSLRRAKLVRDDSQNPPPSVSYMKSAVPGADIQSAHLQSGKANFGRQEKPDEEMPHQPGHFDPERVLHWLARSQNLDGSWPQGVEFTSAALLAFARHGHTGRRGHFRKQAQRAANWLSQAAVQNTDAYARILALQVFALADRDQPLMDWVKQARQTLAPPSNLFEETVHALLENSGSRPAIRPAGEKWSLDEIRSAAALNIPVDLQRGMPDSIDTELAQVWLAAIHP